jgi:HlyD family secretion protein
MKIFIIGYIILSSLQSINAAYATELPAILHYAQVVELGVPVSGVVGKVHVSDGQHINKDQILLELDETPFLAELNKTNAEIRRLGAERDEAKKALDRDLELYERMVLSTVDLDRRKLDFVRADSLYQSEQAQLSLANYHYAGSKLYAPFDGLVISSNAYPGMAVHVDLKPPVLFLFANTMQFSAEADVPADKITGISIGDSIDVLVAGRKHSGKVNNITMTSEGRSLSQPSQYRVKVLLDPGGMGLMPGQPATLVIDDNSQQ